ncbi:hypothetical protein [Flavobacterium xinjiangense]|uniref:Uncharacterized protein n=1 Tax=Flavobacterium xinjiangense TaxID=178356 RepID=A0A1M7M8H2_9FLAO|nr:hypothetical protein [Flavobacterium xinjiangense]SHM86985.1 hypothetical protein SAMN05216269_10821 [Flavobacterium xinjiangense]
MKKLLIVAGMVLLSTGTFAKEKTTKKPQKKQQKKTNLKQWSNLNAVQPH